MRIRRRACCRADGRLYCIVDLEGAGGAPAAEASAEASLAGSPIPAELYPYEDGAWVVVLPFLARARLRVTLAVGEERGSFDVNCARARWESSLVYRLRKDLPPRLRGVQDSWLHDRLRPSLDRLLAGDGVDVWRVSVTWQGSDETDPALELLDDQGRPLEGRVLPFERQLHVPTPAGVPVNRSFFSVELPEGLRCFVLRARDQSGLARGGFCSSDERFWADKEHETWLHMRDARADDAHYVRWFEEHRAKGGDLEVQAHARLAYEPLVSLVVPCYRSDAGYLGELVSSVRAQSYGRWELLLLDSTPQDGVVRAAAKSAGVPDERVHVLDTSAPRGIVGNTNAGIAAARGDYVAFLDHDDLLEPDALFRYVDALNVPERPDVLFCDEDLFSQRGAYRQPIFKTRLNVDLLYSHNCVTHLLCVRRGLVDEMGVSPDDVEGAQDYDLVLRALARGARFAHVARVLYHWREHEGSTSGDHAQSKPYAEEAGRLALARHLESRGIGAEVALTERPFVYRVRYELPDPHPLVSVVIPSRDHVDLLRSCMGSLLERSAYDALEVVVVENNSELPETRAYYHDVQASHPGIVRVIDASSQAGEFNYSRLVNAGAAAARGSYLLLLNNDTEVISTDFVEEMLGYLQRPEVGVVGAKLYFRDGLTQHAGMLVGPHGAVAHPNQDFPPQREGYLSRAVRPGNFSAVTGACQMVRREVFEEVGGYDEDFAVGFNDVDFCFRVRATGRLVTFTPYAELYHYEFVSRGREVADPGKLMRWKREQALFVRRWPEVFVEGDPYTNPNLDVDSAYYGL